MIKAIFFDMDNTLMDNHKCAEHYLKFVCDNMGIPYTQEFYDTYFKINPQIWKSVEEGKIKRADVPDIRFKRVFDALNINLDYRKAESFLYEGIALSHELVDGAEEVLRILSKDYSLFVASNSRPGQQQNRMRLAGVDKYITKYFISGEIGAEKPNREFFEGAFSQIPDIAPHEVMMVGDSLRADIKGGGAFGLTTCWFDYYRNGGDFPSVKPDITILSLRELLGLLVYDTAIFVSDDKVSKASADAFIRNDKAYKELAK